MRPANIKKPTQYSTKGIVKVTSIAQKSHIACSAHTACSAQTGTRYRRHDHLDGEIYTGLGMLKQALCKEPHQLSILPVQVHALFVVLSQQRLIVLGTPPATQVWGIVCV